MTRAQALEQARIIIDDLIARGIEQYFDSRDHALGERAAMRRELQEWAKIAELEQQMAAMERSLLH